MCRVEELEAFDPLHGDRVDMDGGARSLCCLLETTGSSFLLLMLRERLFPWHHSFCL
jgi:hypothetical protein